jgi:hypothetical protein
MQASLDERQAKGKQIVIPFDGKPQKPSFVVALREP